MATLDALLQLQRLMAPGRLTVPYGINPEMNDGRPPPQGPSLPPGLPDAVRESILQGRSYGEGQVIPRPQEQMAFKYRDFAPDFANQMSDPYERERLSRELDYMAAPKQYPTREGFPLTAPDRYSRPYNLGLGNLGALF